MDNIVRKWENEGGRKQSTLILVTCIAPRRGNGIQFK